MCPYLSGTTMLRTVAPQVTIRTRAAGWSNSTQ